MGESMSTVMPCVNARSFGRWSGWRSIAGNTPAVCHRCYIHPEIFEGYFDGTLLATLAEKTGLYLTEEIEGMSAEEAAVVAFLGLRLGELAEKTAA
jgi:DNA topoisomerase I